MTNHPEVQHKLRRHLIERIPGIADWPISNSDLSPINTPYLEAVVWETLRVSMLVNGTAREGESLDTE
jgi:cytochrome P450